MKYISVFVLILFISLSSCQKKQGGTLNVEETSLEANAYFDSVFYMFVDRSPTFLTYLGKKKDYDKWDDMSPAFGEETNALKLEVLDYLNDSIDVAKLDKETALSYKLLKESIVQETEMFKYRYHNYPVNQMFGEHSRIASFLINFHRVDSVTDAEAYVSRLAAVPEYFDQLKSGLTTRKENGIVLPEFLFEFVIRDCNNIIEGAPFDKSSSMENELYADFEKKVGKLDIDKEAQHELITRGKRVMLGSVKPAYLLFITFLQDLQKQATADAGAWKFPEGEAFYKARLKEITTTDMSPEEIFALGQSEVKRIHGEMENIKNTVGFEGTLQEFFTFIEEDPQFYFPNTEKSKQQYLDSTHAIVDNMRARLPELFNTFPKAELKVKPVEAFREKSAGIAFYTRPAPDGSRPGIYYVNLHDMSNMPVYELEALAYHEAIPGHHMQLAIAQELKGLPEFRKNGNYTAYIEGWGLYCEAIPKELGLYSNPYSDFGRLSMELWRACRLVADVGIHVKKWTREEALAFYTENTPSPATDCRKMVDRHMVMPAQATAYKVGMLKIMALRAKAKAALGEKFDIRAFHDVVLTNGALPLNVLEDNVDQWIEATKI